MNSSFIGKVEKAKRYSEERNRLRFKSFDVEFKGDNHSHNVAFDDGRWRCTCNFFAGAGLCSHTMALERILEGMIPREVAAGA